MFFSHHLATKKNFIIYEGIEKNIQIIVGDIYECTSDAVGQFDGIWDCNAMVVVNPDDREKYVGVLKQLIKPDGKILMSTFLFDQSLHTAFPHSISPDLTRHLFEPEMKVIVAELAGMEDPFVIFFLEKCNIPYATRPIFYIEREFKN